MRRDKWIQVRVTEAEAERAAAVAAAAGVSVSDFVRDVITGRSPAEPHPPASGLSPPARPADE